MPRLQSRPYWNKERELALLKLGKAATTNNGHKDWEQASELYPKERKLLKEKTNSQLSKTYLRVLKSHDGICMRARCNKPAADGGRYCSFHRKTQSENARRFPKRTPYSIIEIETHKIEVRSLLKTCPKDVLVDFILSQIHRTTIQDRKKLLEPRYSNILKRR